MGITDRSRQFSADEGNALDARRSRKDQDDYIDALLIRKQELEREIRYLQQEEDAALRARDHMGYNELHHRRLNLETEYFQVTDKLSNL